MRQGGAVAIAVGFQDLGYVAHLFTPHYYVSPWKKRRKFREGEGDRSVFRRVLVGS